MSEGPNNTLTLQDLVLLKKCVEKGSQKGIFDYEELIIVKQLHKKMVNILIHLDKLKNKT